MFASGTGVEIGVAPALLLPRLEAAGWRRVESGGSPHAAPADACSEASGLAHLSVLAIWLSCVEMAVMIWSEANGFCIMTLPGTPSAAYSAALSPDM